MPGIPIPGILLTCSKGIPMPVFASWGLSRTCPKECDGTRLRTNRYPISALS
jgi:hypothetical protein